MDSIPTMAPQRPFLIAMVLAAAMALPLLVYPSPAAGGKSNKSGESNEAAQYTGSSISLDFTNADIHNVVRFIADVSGVNIVVAGDVMGTVTIKLKDVPWDMALDVILKDKNLMMIREDGLVRVVTPGAEIREKKRSLEMKKPD